LSAILIWMTLACVILLPLLAAANSPLLAWRDPYYITAGFAGIIAMSLLLVQPLRVGGYLPGYSGWRGRRFHKWTGATLVTSVITHVAGLWITSPPDEIDVLLFRSPTPFSAWGAIAMWALFAAALVAAFRHRLPLPPRKWRVAHTALIILCVTGSVIHAMLIEGTMELLSKTVLCALVLLATVKTVLRLKVWARGPSR
jgi:predicted ferric reductase